MANDLYRESALQTLSSPDQLDQLMKVTDPRSWIALAAIILVLISVLVWGVFGSLPTTVSGQGVIIRSGGVFDVVTSGAGVLSELTPLKHGDRVRKGQVLGRIPQPALDRQVEAARLELSLARSREQAFRIALQKESTLQRDAFAARRELQEKTIELHEEQLRGLLPAGQPGDTKSGAVLTARLAIDAARGELRKQAVEDAEAGNRYEERLRAESGRVAQAAARLEELEARSRMSSIIISSHDGIVVETMAMSGDAVKEGQTILSVESEREKLEAVVYLPAGGSAKLLAPGKEARVSPVTSRKERYGYLKARVVAVSRYPATEQGMMAVFNNAALVRELTRDGPPIAVTIELDADSRTRSGYAWSSKAGAELELTSGTLCSTSFVIETRRPISLLLPLLRESVGL